MQYFLYIDIENMDISNSLNAFKNYYKKFYLMRTKFNIFVFILFCTYFEDTVIHL